MEQMKTQKISNEMFMVLFFLLLMMNTIERSEYTAISIISKYSLFVTFIAMFFLLMKTWLFPLREKLNYLYSYFAMSLFLLYIVIHFMKTAYMSAGGFMVLLFFLLFIVAAIRVNFHEEEMIAAGFVALVIIGCFFLHWLLGGMELRGFKGVFRNENYLSVLLFCLLYFQVLGLYYTRRVIRSLFRIGLLMNLALIFVSGARSVIIGILVILATYFLVKKFPIILDKLIYLIMLGNLLFVGMYVGLSYTILGQKLNDISVAVTSKNLFSGRHEIWSAVMKSILEKPIFGYGLGVRAKEVAETDLTAHNMYLQLILEFGIIGYALFFCIYSDNMAFIAKE